MRTATRLADATTALAARFPAALTVPQPDLRRANCADPDVDPEVFFPAIPTGWSLNNLDKVAVQVGAAKAICQWCPVRIPCATWAIQAGLNDGIFGGMTPAERRHLKGAVA